MSAEFTIQQAIASDAQEVAVMVGELLTEIMNAIGVQAFNFDLAETTSRLKDFLDREKYFVFVARSGSGSLAGFIALYESYALYAEGAFGTIPELYVRPKYRADGLGLHLGKSENRGQTTISNSLTRILRPPSPSWRYTAIRHRFDL